MIFSSFGSVISSTLFLLLVGFLVSWILFSIQKSPAVTEYQIARRNDQTWRYTACALIFSGPPWGGMIGVFGGLFDLHYKVEDKVGIEFEKGVVVGAVG